MPEKEAKRRAWATVNKESGGGNKSGSGRGKKDTNVSSKRGGKLGGAAAATGPLPSVPLRPRRPRRRASAAPPERTPSRLG